MADVFTKAKRSQVMARIRGKGNKSTELALAGILRSNGINGWRRGQPVFGKPDFVFQTAKLAVFVDGCFWHGCPRHATTPATNRAFWRLKLLKNKQRDKRVSRTLRSEGWKVIRIWECALMNPPAISRLTARIRNFLGGRSTPVPQTSQTSDS